MAGWRRDLLYARSKTPNNSPIVLHSATQERKIESELQPLRKSGIVLQTALKYDNTVKPRKKGNSKPDKIKKILSKKNNADMSSGCESRRMSEKENRTDDFLDLSADSGISVSSAYKIDNNISIEKKCSKLSEIPENKSFDPICNYEECYKCFLPGEDCYCLDPTQTFLTTFVRVWPKNKLRLIKNFQLYCVVIFLYCFSRGLSPHRSPSPIGRRSPRRGRSPGVRGVSPSFADSTFNAVQAALQKRQLQVQVSGF